MEIKNSDFIIILNDHSATNILINLMDQKINSLVQFAGKAGDGKIRLNP